MDLDGDAVPNELAFRLAAKCRRWTYASYAGEHEVNEVPIVPTVERAYETRLERAINDTQAKITSQKRVLEDLRKKLQDEEEKQPTLNLSSDAMKLHDLATQLLKVQAMTKSQNYLSHIVSQIPSSESPLNALLTRENVEEVNEQTSETLRMVRDDIAELKERIAEEKLFLEEHREIQDALKERLASLRTQSQQSAQQYLNELQHQKTAYTTSKRILTQGLQQFIKEHLAPILHAEAKGAIPGDPDSLPKKKRRRDDDETAERDLATRMITLVEELLNRLVTPGGESPWVEVLEDDVVVRCLVRANIALMNPNDGSKIRLVEFHKEVDGNEMEEDI